MTLPGCQLYKTVLRLGHVITTNRIWATKTKIPRRTKPSRILTTGGAVCIHITLEQALDQANRLMPGNNKIDYAYVDQLPGLFVWQKILSKIPITYDLFFNRLGTKQLQTTKPEFLVDYQKKIYSN